jgi:hypothetical protein
VISNIRFPFDGRAQALRDGPASAIDFALAVGHGPTVEGPSALDGLTLNSIGPDRQTASGPGKPKTLPVLVIHAMPEEGLEPPTRGL